MFLPIRNQKPKTFATKILLSSLIVINSFLQLGCFSASEQLRRHNPNLYQQIVGEYYILSEDKFGEVEDIISFEANGNFKIASLEERNDLCWQVINPENQQVEQLEIAIYQKNNEGKLSEALNGNNYLTTFYFNKYSLPKNSLYQEYSVAQKTISIKDNTNTFAYSQDQDLIKKLIAKNRTKNKKFLEKKWNNINKYNLKELVNYYNEIEKKNLGDLELKENVELRIRLIIDLKMYKYIIDQYPFMEEYLNEDLYSPTGEKIESCFLLFPKYFFLINQYTGEELCSCNFKKTKKGFNFYFKKNEEIIFYFKNYKNKIILYKLKVGNEENPLLWESAASKSLETIANEEFSINCFDIEQIEKYEINEQEKNFLDNTLKDL